MKKIISYILIFLCAKNICAQEKLLFIGATAHLGNGEKIENSIISVKDGRFDLIGDAKSIRINPDSFDTIIKLYGKHIYPGFILTNNILGITEISAVRASNDYNEVGEFNPNVRSIIAFNTESKIINTVRSNGILITQATPKGGIMSGQSSIMLMDGWNWEDACLKESDGIHLNWPSSYHTSGWWGNHGETSKNKKYIETVSSIKDFLRKASAYAKSNSKKDLRLESTRGLFNGNKILYIHAKYAKEIRESIIFCKEIGVQHIVLVGGKDVLNALTVLKKHQIPVILDRIHRLPINQDSPIDEAYILPSKLKENDILFCLSYNGEMEAMGSRNLPFTAGTTIAYGMSPEEALSTITLNAAKILRIDKTDGSIEHNKNATFFISSGDALDIKTNHVEQAYIKGKPINLNNHQKDLFNKFKDH